MLRDYQIDLYLKTYESIKNGNRGILVQSPCRSGKSYIMLEMIKNLKGTALVLAHRKELIKQHKELLKDTENCRVESVFTEANHLGEHDDPSVIFIDEAHLSEANSYKKVCDYYQCIVIGFTATPIRLSGERLSLYDSIVQGITPTQLIDMGAISKYDYLAPNIGVDASDVSIRCGDYVNSELSELMSKPKIYGDVVKYYKELANDKQSICYCSSVKNSIEMAKRFNDDGITARHIDATSKDREEVMEDFKSGKFKVLCNVGLISEGITVPDCECCLLLRPTQSLSLYIQQSMRCLTPKEGKKALIIDFVGNFQRHGLPTMNRVWELKGTEKFKKNNEDGSFTIRQCPECFKVFNTANECPYCGHKYEVKGRELEQMHSVELKKITESEIKELERRKKLERMEVGKARCMSDLWKIANERGYKPGWVFYQAKIKGIRG